MLRPNILRRGRLPLGGFRSLRRVPRLPSSPPPPTRRPSQRVISLPCEVSVYAIDPPPLDRRHAHPPISMPRAEKGAALGPIMQFDVIESRVGRGRRIDGGPQGP